MIYWQGYGKGTAAAFGRIHRNPAAMLFNNFLGNRQPQGPGAIVLDNQGYAQNRTGAESALFIGPGRKAGILLGIVDHDGLPGLHTVSGDSLAFGDPETLQFSFPLHLVLTPGV